MAPAPTDDIVRQFLDGTLPATAWTHEAHLAVCRALLDESPDPHAVLVQLRELITKHNQRLGLAPYHETITRYYVLAVAHCTPPTLEGALADPACTREAPLRHWTRERLLSPRARTRWVGPDRLPLPWTCAT